MGTVVRGVAWAGVVLVFILVAVVTSALGVADMVNTAASGALGAIVSRLLQHDQTNGGE